MGSKQSKRSVDISGKEGEAAAAAGGGEVAAAGGEGRVEPIADVDALKPQLNGDTPHIEPPPEPLSEKEKQLENGSPENEKDASTEKEQMAATANGAGEAHDATNGDGAPAPEPEKKKKEKVKKKWSLRSISFSRKDKPKHEKKQKEEDKASGEQLAEEAAEATGAESKVEEAATAKPEEAKEQKTPDTPVTESITNGSSAPESPKDEAPTKEASPAPTPVADAAPEPQEPLTNGSVPEVAQQAKPVAAEPASTPDTPVTREVCVTPASSDPAPPPPLPANPPPSSFAAFAETAMAPLPADAVLAAAAAAPQETAAPICEAEPTPIPEQSPVAAAEPILIPELSTSAEASPAPQTVEFIAETTIIAHNPTEQEEPAQNQTEQELTQNPTEQAELIQNSPEQASEPIAEPAEQTPEPSERVSELAEKARESIEIDPETASVIPEKSPAINETKESEESNSTHAVVEPEPKEKLETIQNVEPANVPLPLSDDEAQNQPEETKSESDPVTNDDKHLDQAENVSGSAPNGVDSALSVLTNGHANGSASEPLPPPAADEDASAEDVSDSFPLPPSELSPAETHQSQEAPAADLPKDTTLEINSEKSIADMKEAASAVAAERSAELTEAAAGAPTD